MPKYIMLTAEDDVMIPNTILAIGAHPDDIEVGAGGMIAKFRERGASVHYVIFSKCTKNTGIGKADLANEARNAANVLGVKDVRFFDFENTMLAKSSADIRKIMEELRDELKPDFVLCSNACDLHQDHATLGCEALRVFRGKETLLFYEIIRKGAPLIESVLFVDITDQIGKKVDAIKCFKSQYKRSYFSDETYRALALVRGAQTGCKYAEAFRVVRGFL